MAGAVLSVERVSINIPTSTVAASALLTEFTTDTANCVPFVTRRVSTDNGNDLAGYVVDAYFTDSGDPGVPVLSGGDTIEVSREDDWSEASVLEVEVTVVEFDPARINVVPGAFSMPSDPGGDDVDVTISPSLTDYTNAFLVFHSYQGATSEWGTYCIRGRITSNSNLNFGRAVYYGTADGHWYVVEDESSDFTVEATDVQLADVASNTDTVTLGAGDLGNTFLIGSSKADATSIENQIHTVDATLTTNTVTVQRDDTSDTIDWSGFVVKMADGTSVERGTIAGQGATALQNVTIGTVDDDRAMPSIAGSMGSAYGGSFPGDAAADVPDAHVGMTLTSTTNLRVEHNTSGGEADNDISWEVIDWGEGAAAATRRIMVIS